MNKIFTKGYEQVMKNDEIVILGHENPDCDSIIAGILLAEVFKTQNINANFIIPDKIVDKETMNILTEFNIDVSEYFGVVNENQKVFLVDHYKREGFNVIGAIDHHPNMEYINYEVCYINEKSNATAMIIYKYFKDIINENLNSMINLIVLASVIDTNTYRSTKNVKDDEMLTEYLISKFSLNRELLYRAGDCLTDLTDVAEYAVHGKKEYIYNKNRVASSYVQISKELSTYNDKSFMEEAIRFLINEVKNSDLEMWVFIVSNLKKDSTIEIRITEDKVKIYEHNILLSRGNDIMPKIERLFS